MGERVPAVVAAFGYGGVGGTYDTTGPYYGRLWEIKTLPQGGGTALQDVKHTWDAGLGY